MVVIASRWSPVKFLLINKNYIKVGNRHEIGKEKEKRERENHEKIDRRRNIDFYKKTKSNWDAD